jgi:hypothetical protein
MKSKSRAKVWKQWGEPLGIKTGILIAAFLPAFCVLSALKVGAKDLPVDRAGATMMSYRSLIKAREKFDRKPVWVVGGLRFTNGTAYLGASSSGQGDSHESVCVVPTESFIDPTGSGERATLARFDGMLLAVHGRYERASTPQCPNGTIFAALLEVSLE